MKEEKKVLVVDDHLHLRKLLERILIPLKSEGISILLAENGKQALEMIEKERPHLVFLDVMMPEMDGYEVCERVKKDPILARSYIVILTARTQQIDKERAEKVGMDEFMLKPFDPKAVLKLTRKVLKLPDSNEMAVSS